MRRGIVAVALAVSLSAQAQHSMPGMDMPAATPPASVPTADNGHVPPPPPAHAMDPMSVARMAEVMQMHDDAIFSMTKIDELERGFGRGDPATAWNAEGWIGGDTDRLWWRSEGDRDRDGTHDASVEALYGHALAAFWDGQLGVRHDFGGGPARDWLAVGVQGLAPYWFELETTAYVGEGGRTAARVEASYAWLFTQRLILTPKIELNAYGKSDREREIGRGVSDAAFELRLRYEFNRHVAPYLGVAWDQRVGNTASLVRARGESAGQLRWLAGIRLWL